MKSRAGPNCALSVTGGDGLRITRPHQRTLKRYIYGQPRPSRTRSALPSVCTRTEGLRQNHTSIAELGALSCPPAPPLALSGLCSQLRRRAARCFDDMGESTSK